MPIKCTFKPNRKRVRTFTAKDVGRIACAAVQDGVSRRDIRLEIGKCIDDSEDECQKIRQLVPIILNAALAIVALLAIALPVLRVIRQILLSGQIIFDMLPGPVRLRLQQALDDLLTVENRGTTIEGEFRVLIDELRQITR